MDEDIRDEERKRELALGSDDTPIYPHLPFVNKTHFRRDKGKPQGFCHGIIIEEGELNTRVDWEPEELPFLKGDIQHLLDHELNGMEGFWTVRFLNDDLAFRGVTYDDGFRSVFRFRTLEFMIRPLSENNNGGAFGPKNLKFVDPRHPSQPVIDMCASLGSASALTLFFVIIIGSAISTRCAV